MRLWANLLAVVVGSFIVWAQDRQTLMDELQKLDTLASQYTTIWEADIQHMVITSEKEKREIERIARISGAKGFRLCDGKIEVTKRITIQRLNQGCVIVVDGFNMCGKNIVDVPVFLYSADGDVVYGSSIEGIPLMVYVWRGGSPLYNILPNMHLTANSFPTSQFLYGLLCGANPFRIKGLDVLRMELQGNEVSFVGSLQRPVTGSIKSVEKVLGKLVRARDFWAVKQFQIETTGMSSFNATDSYTVEEFTEIDKIPIPLRIRYESKVVHDGSVTQTKAHIRLVKHQKTQNLSIDIPFGAQTNDLRLSDKDWYQTYLWSEGQPKESVIYPWSGRLPSLEELKRLAYAQGNLLPPEAPRRRYSLVLFVPAVVLFLLAGYLYWKQRKK